MRYILIFMIAVATVVATMWRISLECTSVDSNGGCAEDVKAICPSSSFYLPPDTVSSMEFAALHNGNQKAAVRLGGYYHFFRSKALVGDIWQYRAAQLGDVLSLYDILVRGSCYLHSQTFSPDFLNSIDFRELSEIVKEYVRFNVCHFQKEEGNMKETHAAKQDWTIDLAVARTGSMDAFYVRNGHRLSWPVEFIAYRTRQRSGICFDDKVIEGVLLFSEFIGKACQTAVDVAESHGRVWIVLSVEYEDRFGLRPVELKSENLCICTYKILERVFEDFLLASDTKVSFVGDVVFVEQMAVMSSNKFVVSPVPDIFAYKLQRCFQPK